MIRSPSELLSMLGEVLGPIHIEPIKSLATRGYWLEYKDYPSDLPGYRASENVHYLHIYPGTTGLTFYVAVRTDGTTPKRAASTGTDRKWSPERKDVPLSDLVGSTPPSVSGLVGRALGIGAGIPCDQ